MPILPQTVCRRCHRKYSALRGRCPYCNTKKEKEVHTVVPESDSAVKGTEASGRAAESLNWQLLIGGVLIIAVVIAMIAVISVNMKNRVDEEIEITEPAANPGQLDLETTPVPVPTPSPTPSPTPAPAVTSIQITYYGADMPDFMEPAGSQIQLEATWYPATVDATVVWTSSDENIATVDDTGLVTVVSSSGHCSIYATIGDVYDECIVYTR